MNLQPPDPPEYGHCLTCKRSVHESEVRGGHCIECEGHAMTNKIAISELTAVVERHSRQGTGKVDLIADLRDLLGAAADAVPYAKPAVYTHGEPDDDAACMDCLKAWGRYPFKAPEAERLAEPIYQFAANTSTPSWTDISREVFDEYSQRGEWLTRALLAAPVADGQEPVMHITPQVLGMLKGELRMQSGGITFSESKPIGNWTVPLFTTPPAPPAVDQLLRDAYEHGYVDGQNNPNGYGDKVDRDKCVVSLLDGITIAPADPDRLLKDALFACIEAGGADRNYGGVLTAGDRHAWVRFTTSPGVEQAAPPECKTCGGTQMVDDGEIHCSEGGIPFENGPIKRVAMCPDCRSTVRAAPACSTCQDHGVIGWTSGQTAESFDQGERECPDCSEAVSPVAVVKHAAMGCIDWFVWPRDLPLGTKLYTSPPAPVLPEPEQLFEAIAGALGEAMDCTRVWAAWGVGTMSEDDFSLVADDQERLHEIASACLTKIKESNQ